MALKIFSGLFDKGERHKRYVVENLKNYIDRSDAIVFGRYSGADDMMGLLVESGALTVPENKDKNIYCASRRSKAYALSLGINPKRLGSTEDLKVIKESQRLYAGSEEELDAIFDTYSPEELSSKYIISDDQKLVNLATKKLNTMLRPGVEPESIMPVNGPGRAIMEMNANDKRENYVFIDGVDQIDQNKYMLAGDDMKLGFIKRYSMKDLKELMYYSNYFAAVSRAPKAEYLGENGKRLVVQYRPGMEKEALDALQRELMLTDDMLASHKIRKRTGMPKNVSFTRDEMNVMTVPFDARGVKNNLMLSERDLEDSDSIGRFGTGLCTNKMPHGVVYKLPKGDMTFEEFYPLDHI